MTYNQGYTAKQHSVPVKRYCQTLNLKNNPALIAEYRKIHSKKEAWPEIRKGIRSVGILEMEIYISGFQVFMIIEKRLINRSKILSAVWSEELRKSILLYQHKIIMN